MTWGSHFSLSTMCPGQQTQVVLGSNPLNPMSSPFSPAQSEEGMDGMPEGGAGGLEAFLWLLPTPPLPFVPPAEDSGFRSTWPPPSLTQYLRVTRAFLSGKNNAKVPVCMGT